MRSIMTAMAATAFLAAGCASDDQAAKTTAPVGAGTAAACKDLGWEISTGAFSGGAELPAQLFGADVVFPHICNLTTDWEVFYISAPDMDGGIPTVGEEHFSCDGA